MGADGICVYQWAGNNGPASSNIGFCLETDSEKSYRQKERERRVTHPLLILTTCYLAESEGVGVA